MSYIDKGLVFASLKPRCLHWQVRTGDPWTTAQRLEVTNDHH